MTTLLQIQARLLADAHREAWTGIELKDLERWLARSTRMISRRWRRAFESAQASETATHQPPN